MAYLAFEDRGFSKHSSTKVWRVLDEAGNAVFGFIEWSNDLDCYAFVSQMSVEINSVVALEIAIFLLQQSSIQKHLDNASIKA